MFVPPEDGLMLTLVCREIQPFKARKPGRTMRAPNGLIDGPAATFVCESRQHKEPMQTQSRPPAMDAAQRCGERAAPFQTTYSSGPAPR